MAAPAWEVPSPYYGTSTDHPLTDLLARRHLMPSIMDDPISVERQCVCPGAPTVENSCIDVWDDYDDRLCEQCRAYCYFTDEQGVQHRFVDVYGTVLPDLPSAVVWGPNEKRTRAHVFVEECRGCHGSLAEHLTTVAPSSLCRQAWGKSWADISGDSSSLPHCITCTHLLQAREEAKEKRI